MPNITTFFRHCPSCGRRFEIRLIGKSLVGTEKDTYPTTSSGYDEYTYPLLRSRYGNVISPTPFELGGPGRSFVELEEKVRVTVERKEFQYAYKCKHCGHRWAEERFEETQPGVEKR
jgi:hypothetical protein